MQEQHQRRLFARAPTPEVESDVGADRRYRVMFDEARDPSVIPGVAGFEDGAVFLLERLAFGTERRLAFVPNVYVVGEADSPSRGFRALAEIVLLAETTPEAWVEMA